MSQGYRDLGPQFLRNDFWPGRHLGDFSSSRLNLYMVVHG